MNVLEDPEGMERLRRFGARSLPVVARGEKFVIAQVISDVVTFLGLDVDTKPVLTPAQLSQRYDHVLATAIRLARQMPHECLTRELVNRKRSWRVLMHHIFQIPISFLDMEDTGQQLSSETLLALPPEEMQTSEQIAAFGEQVRTRFADWWLRAEGEDFTGRVPTYFGGTSRLEMLERTVWHSTQHARQLASLLERAGIEPDRPLTAADIQGLPLTEKIWDDG